MIRLLIIAIGILLLWVLFVSNFKKSIKIILTICVLVIFGVGIWVEQADKVLKSNIIDATEIIDCGVSAKHSYRTNYDVDFCLRNDSLIGVAKQINLDFIALRCVNGECSEIQKVNQDVLLSLEAKSSDWLTENVDFDKVSQVPENGATLLWSIDVQSVKAIK